MSCDHPHQRATVEWQDSLGHAIDWRVPQTNESRSDQHRLVLWSRHRWFTTHQGTGNSHGRWHAGEWIRRLHQWKYESIRLWRHDDGRIIRQIPHPARDTGFTSSKYISAFPNARSFLQWYGKESVYKISALFSSIQKPVGFLDHLCHCQQNRPQKCKGLLENVSSRNE